MPDSNQHSDLRAALYLADDIEASEKELLDSGWGGYPWEHLGDASRDIHKLIRGLREAAGLIEQKETADLALGKIALMQSGALAIIRDNGFVFESIGKEPGNWQHLAFTLYTLICEIDVEARHALGIEIGDEYPASSPKEGE